MGILGWIVIGGIAGWIASLITGNSKRMGTGMNILVGIVGGFVGGIVMNLLGGYGVSGFNLRSLMVATLGAVILLLIVNAVKRRT